MRVVQERVIKWRERKKRKRAEKWDGNGNGQRTVNKGSYEAKKRAQITEHK